MKKILYFTTLLLIAFSACKKDDSSPEEPTDKPVVSSIQPKDPKPGDVVTISGTGFGTNLADVKLSIGSTAITPTSVTNTEIKFTLPDNVSAGELSVKIKENTATVNDAQGATISPKPGTAPLPTFTALSASSGKAGDAITLSGTNFSTVLTDNTVKFSGATASTTVSATIKTATATSLTVDVPAGAASGPITIAVKGVSATLASGFNGVFTVTAPSGGGTGTSGQSTVLSTLQVRNASITADANGNVYALQNNGAFPTKLLRLSTDGQAKIFSPADFGYAANDFLGVAGVASDKNGVIYVATVDGTSKTKIFKIASASTSPALYLDLKGTVFGINSPESNFAVTSAGEIYFLTSANPKNVYKINTKGEHNIFIDVNYGAAINEYDNAQKPLPTDISLDHNDNLYVSAENETNFKAIYKFTPAKVRTVVYSSSADAFESGTLATAKFKSITSMSVSPDGNTFFIGDYKSKYVSKLDLSANQVSTVAGIGEKADSYNYSQTGANLSVLVYPWKVYYDYRTQTLYSLFSTLGVQKIKL